MLAAGSQDVKVSRLEESQLVEEISKLDLAKNQLHSKINLIKTTLALIIGHVK